MTKSLCSCRKSPVLMQVHWLSTWVEAVEWWLQFRRSSDLLSAELWAWNEVVLLVLVSARHASLSMTAVRIKLVSGDIFSKDCAAVILLLNLSLKEAWPTDTSIKIFFIETFVYSQPKVRAMLFLSCSKTAFKYKTDRIKFFMDLRDCTSYRCWYICCRYHVL